MRTFLWHEKKDTAMDGGAGEETGEEKETRRHTNDDEGGGFVAADCKSEGLSKEYVAWEEPSANSGLRESVATSGEKRTKEELRAQTETLREEKRVNRHGLRKIRGTALERKNPQYTQKRDNERREEKRRRQTEQVTGKEKESQTGIQKRTERDKRKRRDKRVAIGKE
ncbi:hypothetical protein NDU88_003500 [Pleurodeles waltl]|uniref:Uncharacterized protein n=1 Tax=Pleurodeles waltl TaxID=8319 RepID=A0AAV7NIA1_PLEWA|nr:hypothetical protein NDU88_003500 [Pleurodeles waltl]